MVRSFRTTWHIFCAVVLAAVNVDSTDTGSISVSAIRGTNAQQQHRNEQQTNFCSTTRCGVDWTDANFKCGVECTLTDEPCVPFGEKCFADLSTANPCCSDANPAPPPPPPPSSSFCSPTRCGLTFAEANFKCGVECTFTDEPCVPFGEQCFADLSTAIPCCSDPDSASPPPPPPSPPTPSFCSSTRCGVDWSDANSKCGVECTLADEPCVPFGEKCFADVSTTLDCCRENPAPMPAPTAPQTPPTGAPVTPRPLPNPSNPPITPEPTPFPTRNPTLRPTNRPTTAVPVRVPITQKPSETTITEEEATESDTPQPATAAATPQPVPPVTPVVAPPTSPSPLDIFTAPPTKAPLQVLFPMPAASAPLDILTRPPTKAPLQILFPMPVASPTPLGILTRTPAQARPDVVPSSSPLCLLNHSPDTIIPAASPSMMPSQSPSMGPRTSTDDPLSGVPSDVPSDVPSIICPPDLVMVTDSPATNSSEEPSGSPVTSGPTTPSLLLDIAQADGVPSPQPSSNEPQILGDTKVTNPTDSNENENTNTASGQSIRRTGNLAVLVVGVVALMWR